MFFVLPYPLSSPEYIALFGAKSYNYAMVGGRPTVDLPRAVRARIEARAGDAAFVVPVLRTPSKTAAADLHTPPWRGTPRDVPPRDVGREARIGRSLGDGGWLLVSVGDESGQRP